MVADFVPPSYPLEIELQNLAAVQECTSRELLPEVYRTMERDSSHPADPRAEAAARGALRRLARRTRRRDGWESDCR